VTSRTRTDVPDRSVVRDVQLGNVGTDTPVHGLGILARLAIRVVDRHSMPAFQEFRVRLAWLPSERTIRLEVVVGELFILDAAKEDASQFELRSPSFVTLMSVRRIIAAPFLDEQRRAN
jgi:hypothetical protein